MNWGLRIEIEVRVEVGCLVGVRMRVKGVMVLEFWPLVLPGWEGRYGWGKECGVVWGYRRMEYIVRRAPLEIYWNCLSVLRHPEVVKRSRQTKY